MNEPQPGKYLEEGGEAQITVNVSRKNLSNQLNVAFNNFPKHKEPSWFILIANPETNDLICLKRVAMRKFASKQLVVLLPEDFSTPYQILLLCDSYIGLDLKVIANFEKVNERIMESNKKESKPSIAYDDCFETYKVFHMQED